jgi:glycerol-3-phosphate dehydrogenase
LELSRRSIVYPDRERPWITVYGGKLTGCRELAAQIRGQVGMRLGDAPNATGLTAATVAEMASTSFPGIDQPLPSPQWCRQHEFCCTLEDYLRRRTDIAQWQPRAGLGRDNANRQAVLAIAQALHGADAAAVLDRYENKVGAPHDRLLAELTAGR